MKPDTTVAYVIENSLANEAGIEQGDIILSVNGNDFYDILEYRFLTSEYEVELDVLKKNGQREIITIENDYEDLGIEFKNPLLSKPQSCKNKCIFCFIDQLPKGMRDTVYFKDDDTRLSFLQGNYVTLTNLSDAEIDRMIKMRISPINISVHTTNPELRVLMLKNKNASKIFDIMKKFYDNRISMNCQIVLCPDYNDGKELDRTISDLASLFPYVESVSVVPVGLTKHRQGLAELKPYDKEASRKVVLQVTKWQEKLLKELKSRFVYLSDEFYINSGIEIPDSMEYEGFPQIENGVGLISSMREEFFEAIKLIKSQRIEKTVSVVTGTIAYDFIKSLCNKLEDIIFGLKIEVYPIKNTFFGESVTVSGLVTGKDIINQLNGKETGSELFIPSVMLKSGENVFLDDVTVSDIEQALNVKVTDINNDGYEFVEKITGIELEF